MPVPLAAFPMIDAKDFIRAAGDILGIRHYSGVPCSFLTPFINNVINDSRLHWISSTNEGDALATAAGLVLGGKPALTMMQNSGLGNAVSPLTSLNWVFELPVLLIITHRGAAGIADEPQHKLIGRILPQLLTTMEIPAQPFPAEAGDILPALRDAKEYMQRKQKPWAFIMQKGGVKTQPLQAQPVPLHAERSTERKSFLRSEEQGVKLHSRRAALQHLLACTSVEDTIIIATTGYTGRELFALADRPNHLYMVGSMGCASALGLGVALARPDKHVIVVDGDGAALMRMGNLATVGTYAGNNFTHLLLDNGVHDSTGGQETVAANVKFADIAAACSYRVSWSGNDLSLIDQIVQQPAGPRFVHLKLRPGTAANLPRPSDSPAAVKHRLVQHLGLHERHTDNRHTSEEILTTSDT